MMTRELMRREQRKGELRRGNSLYKLVKEKRLRVD